MISENEITAIAEKVGFTRSKWLRVYCYPEPNKKGETLKIMIDKCECDTKVKNSLPCFWYKQGDTPKILRGWFSLKTEVTDSNGNCRGSYNPQLTDNRSLNFDYVQEATADSLITLLDECLRRFEESNIGCVH